MNYTIEQKKSEQNKSELAAWSTEREMMQHGNRRIAIFCQLYNFSNVPLGGERGKEKNVKEIRCRPENVGNGQWVS